MQIAGYLKTSLIEWPGLISSVVFTPGCNFRCPFCHNPELINLSGKSKLLKEEEIISDLEKRKQWVDAVAITGGEPTLQKDLPEFLKKLKKMGYQIMVETNGSKPEVLKTLFKESLVDFIGMDLKGNFEDYDKYAGIQDSKLEIRNLNSKLKNSIEEIIKSGLKYELRTTVVPGLHTKDNLIELAEDIREISGNCSWYLQQFRSTSCLNPEFTKLKPFSKEEMENFQKIFKKHFPQVFLRGVY
ncbi:anaerobic ribonucleoside-triphosphate reductase activating protein [Patescibacteria group bacterium]|nr:anaerobic ribonucleoside-triphosphate reductase activating protein [Patescibacteria group bacterium]